MKSLCPACANEVVRPHGYSHSKILLIGEFPGKDEMEKGRPFVGAAGSVLRKEMALLGLDLYQCRLTNLWLHEPNKDENCFNASLNACLDEAKGKDAILLLGSDTVLYFTGYNVSDVMGLQVESNMLSAPTIFASPNPAIAFHKNVGELRLSITRFVSTLKEEGII